jgi:hypothetical protein
MVHTTVRAHLVKNMAPQALLRSSTPEKDRSAMSLVNILEKRIEKAGEKSNKRFITQKKYPLSLFTLPLKISKTQACKSGDHL